MPNFPVRNPFEPLIAVAVREAVATSPAQTASAPGLVALETQVEVLVSTDTATGATLHPFELNSDVLNDPSARLYAL